MIMPAQRPGKSVQEVGTPVSLLDAVQNRFGTIHFDLAANESNHVVEYYYGPGSPNGEDSLREPWNGLGTRWLNPPYGSIADWAKKCSEQDDADKILMLVPASVGSNWFYRYVDGKALVLFLSPRLTFVGHTNPYPKDIMLCVYGLPPGYECWRWQ